MSAVVIELAPYIERKAQKKQEQYTPEQFLQELAHYWTAYLFGLTEPPKDKP